MKKPTLDLQTLTMISLFAALIFLSIQFFKIPVGAQFIHFGNALVVVGCLIFGSKLGFLAEWLRRGNPNHLVRSTCGGRGNSFYV